MRLEVLVEVLPRRFRVGAGVGILRRTTWVVAGEERLGQEARRRTALRRPVDLRDTSPHVDGVIRVGGRREVLRHRFVVGLWCAWLEEVPGCRKEATGEERERDGELCPSRAPA